MKKQLLIIALLCLSFIGHSQHVKSYRVIFYNTENFFDTIKDPIKDDAEFTPEGKDHWTAERYQHKLDNISRVLAVICAADVPLVIGLAEVENKKVSEDLISQPALRKYPLGVIEEDSPDPRGIDVALLYNKQLMAVISTELLTVKLPDQDRGTRDILYVRARIVGADGEFHFFVNHWPSRRDGKDKSQSRRFAAATVLKSKISTITAADTNARIVILGDLNDNPTDSSVAQILGANPLTEPLDHTKLYDLMMKPFLDGKYTLKYRQENDVFDQMIVSETVIDKSSAVHVRGSVGNIFKERWMLYDHPKYGEIPNRTYSGPKYYGGFSDHLPVYMDLDFGK